MREDNGSKDGKKKKRLITALGFHNASWVRSREISSIKGRTIRKERKIRFII